MAIKRVICSERVRKIPAQFSWVDHRLVRERHIERCDAHAAALYLFLVTVADGQGLSYYSDRSLGRSLSMDPVRLSKARGDLIGAALNSLRQSVIPSCWTTCLRPRCARIPSTRSSPRNFRRCAHSAWQTAA